MEMAKTTAERWQALLKREVVSQQARELFRLAAIGKLRVFV
jgi:hypothetical protein